MDILANIAHAAAWVVGLLVFFAIIGGPRFIHKAVSVAAAWP
jgi:hypothetical protein